MSTPERWIVIPNWDGPTGFQHYRDRTPKWIKTYVELMSDDAYLGLTGHRRAILHGLWLEYATARRRLADDTATLSRRLALKVTRADLEALNHAGWLTFSASAPLAQPEQNRSLEVEVEKKELARARATPKVKPGGAPTICPICGADRELDWKLVDHLKNVHSLYDENERAKVLAGAST